MTKVDRYGRPVLPPVSHISYKYTACEIHEIGEVFPLRGVAPRTWWQVTGVGKEPLECHHHPTSRDFAVIWARQWLLGVNGGTIELFDIEGNLVERLETGPWEGHPRYHEGVQLELL